MINFILPNSYCALDNIIGLVKENNYQNLFFGVEGDFAFSIFTGRVNNNCGNGFMCFEEARDCVAMYEEISDNMAIIDFSNTQLEDFDYWDSFGEVLLEEFADKKNIYFEVSDISFIDYLTKNYPNIQIILSENYTIFHTEEQIQNLINQFPLNIKYINITILNLCTNINIPKIGILNMDSCFYCPQFPLCLKRENINTLRYRTASSFNDCERKKMIVLKDIIKNLKTLLKETNIIMFGTISIKQIDDYINLITSILAEETKEELQ